MNIVIINPFGIGDVLFTTPLIAALKKKFPESSISYISNQRVSEALITHPEIDEVVAFSRGDLKKKWHRSKRKAIGDLFLLVHYLRRKRFAFAFDVSLDYRMGLVLAIGGVRERIGFNYKKRGRFLTRSIAIDGYHDKHMIAYYGDLLSLVAEGDYDEHMRLLPTVDDQTVVEALVGNVGLSLSGDYIIMAPGGGASWGEAAESKQLPVEMFKTLAARLYATYGKPIIIAGGPDDMLLARHIAADGSEGIISLCGQTSIRELAVLMRHSKLVIANDGGPLHIAVSQDTPTVSFFGPVDEAVYGPYPPDKKHLVITHDCACRPCYHAFRMPKCEHDNQCLKELQVDDIMMQIKQYIQKNMLF